MDIDLGAKSLAELKSHRKEVDKAIASFEKRKRKEAMAAAEAAANEAGFSLADLVGGKKAKKPSAPAKYRNPEDATQTWSGRGRRPDWFKAKIKDGVDEKALLIS